MKKQTLNIKAQTHEQNVFEQYRLALSICPFILICWCSFFPTLLSAQKNPQPYFRNYSTQDGLPSPEVYFAMEDSKGYMWFGTDNGAVRFDGYDFETFDAQNGLMSNVIFHIYEDEKGRIWFGAMTGEIFIMEKDTILPYRYNHLVKGFEGKFTSAGLLHLGKDEKAYIALTEYGLIVIDKNGSVDTIRSDWASSMLVIHYDDFDKTMIIPSYRKDLMNAEELRSKWEIHHKKNFTSPFEIISKTKRIKKILPSPIHGFTGFAQKLMNGNFLIQSGATLHYIQGNQVTWSIPFNLHITEIIPQTDGSIWFCLRNGRGIRRYTNLKALKQDKYEHFLEGLSISNLYIDENKGCWITSEESGVFYSPNIKMLYYNASFGFDSDYISALGFKNGVELFVGTKDKSIYKFNTITHDLNKIGDTYKPSHSFYYDSLYQNLWLGSYYVNNKRKVHVKFWNQLYKKNTIYTENSFENLHLNSKGQLFGHFAYGGLHIIDPLNKKIIFTLQDRKRTYALYSDKKGNLWMGRNNGLFQFKDSITTHCGIQHPAFQNRVEDIDGMPDGSLVFGTKGYGIIKWKGEDIWQVTTTDGLSSNMLEDVEVDDTGVLWASTLNGLNKITFDSSGQATIRTFTMANGLPSDEIYQVKSYNNQVWLCTNKGLVKFHERAENPFSPAPIIKEIQVNSIPVGIKNQALNHNQNNLEIAYLTINYRLNGHISYRYRINQTADWQYTKNRSVNFSALPPGTYNFQVQSQNEDRFWSESSVYTFAILPPWWATWWFRLLVGLIITGIGYGFYRYRIQGIQKENALKEQFVSLEKSALQAQMNPHFIFNCLNSIQNFILKNDRKKAVEYLSRFASLVRHNLDASIKGEVALEEEVGMLDNYLALEQERFNRSFEYEIYVSEDLENDFVEFPSMLIQPFVENAVIHGMGGKKSNGQIKVSFSKKDDILQVIISDNGSGYRQNERKAKISRHKSAGMSITQKRLELLDTNAKNVIQIQIKKNKKGEITGTEVKVLIKKTSPSL